MRNSLIAIFSLVALAIMAMFLFMHTSKTTPSVKFLNGAIVNVELAITQSQQQRGLSGRLRIDEHEGMLFLHEGKEIRYYWMKDMLEPIDIIWIDGNIVAGLLEHVQIQEPPYDLYSSVVPVDKVLEVRDGFVARNNVRVGNTLDIRLPDE